MITVCMGGVQRLVLYAIEDIKPKQHLLYSYGPNYDNSNCIDISNFKYEDGFDVIPPEEQNQEVTDEDQEELDCEEYPVEIEETEELINK